MDVTLLALQALANAQTDLAAAQEMQRANLSTVQDLQRFVPSLTYNATTPGRGTIYFRGVADDSLLRVRDGPGNGAACRPGWAQSGVSQRTP